MNSFLTALRTQRWDDQTLIREHGYEVHFPGDEEEGVLVEL